MRDFWREKKEIEKVCEEKVHLKNLAMGRIEKEQFKINSGQECKEKQYVYQYRNLESFWSIVESDCFWATNARFSNDHEEQRLGTKKLQNMLDGNTQYLEDFGDCYIVCFCDEDDKLSQWRGYAPEGVSIGFDFNNVRPFFIQSAKEDRHLCVFNSCYRVVYIDEDTRTDTFANLFEIEKVYDHGINRKAVEIIPYVKHSGFYEEAESRLVFSGENGDLTDYVHYRLVGNIKVPYLVVKAGDKRENKPEKCFVRLCVEGWLGEKLEKELLQHLNKKKRKTIRVINCTNLNAGQTNDSQCFGCTLRESHIPGINNSNPKCRYACQQGVRFHIECRNEIYLSDSRNQEEVYQALSFFLKGKEEYKEIKIWCEGHLPIRSIRVGSLHNKEIVMESIKHYCKRHYWLNDVKVTSSATPFRSSLL